MSSDAVKPMVSIAKIMTDEQLAAKLASLKEAAKLVESLPAGMPANAGDGQASCEVCDGAGWYQPVAGERYRRCDCIAPMVCADGVPYEFREATLENYREDPGNRSAIAKARHFLDVNGRDLYLSGGVGAGKTRLACSILNAHARKRNTAFFARVPMLLYQMQPGRDREEVAALEQRLFSTSLLVLDDIGAEREQASDFTRRTLLMIYEERGDRGLRTIFTSNKTLSDLSEMQDDDRLASRIAGRADVILLSTADQRLLRRRKADR